MTRSYVIRGIPDIRSAVVTMSATLASFATALVIRALSGQGLSLVILAVVLTLSMSRLPGQHGWKRGLTTVCMVPIVGIGAVAMGQLLQQHFLIGAAVLTVA